MLKKNTPTTYTLTTLGLDRGRNYAEIIE